MRLLRANGAPASGTVGWVTEFLGFPEQAVRFYAELERNNTRAFWGAHKKEYDELVRAPMLALGDTLEAEFGQVKVFRPNRDVRFSPDKSPYKTYQGAIAGRDAGIGYYVEISASGLLVGGGYHSHSSAQVQRYRRAVDEDPAGSQLHQVVTGLRSAGFDLEGGRLKTAPRGYARDHPRLELLQFTSLMALKRFGTPGWLSSPKALDRVRVTWQAIRPLTEWITRHVGAAT